MAGHQVAIATRPGRDINCGTYDALPARAIAPRGTTVEGMLASGKGRPDLSSGAEGVLGLGMQEPNDADDG
jgi:hypothetical protein